MNIVHKCNSILITWYHFHSSDILLVGYYLETYLLNLLIKFHVIGKSKCLPFQRRDIYCNRLLLSEDTRFEYGYIGHKSNLTQFKITVLNKSIIIQGTQSVIPISSYFHIVIESGSAIRKMCR